MTNKRNSSSISSTQLNNKRPKTTIDGLKKEYKYLNWVETSLCTSSPALDYFSFASHVDDNEKLTNSNYKDLLLALQKKANEQK